MQQYEHGDEPGTSAQHEKNAKERQEKDDVERLREQKLAHSITDIDSGYGGSIISDDEQHVKESSIDLSSPDLIAYRGSLQASSAKHNRTLSVNARRQAVSQVNQLQYNENRVALGRAIAAVMRLLKQLQSFNRTSPIYYPTQTKPTPPALTSGESSSASATSLDPSVSSFQGTSDSTLLEPLNLPESNILPQPLPPIVPAPPHGGPVPAVYTDFKVLKLDLKLGAMSSDRIVDSLEKNSIASLLEEKIVQTMKHLASLRERIDDTSSKVLITGDLNAGKSTFCNALLRRKVLPEDQQPCTNVFCEVIDARENNGTEQVHAVLLGAVYDRRDEGTYEIFTLKDLDFLVGEIGKYSILKVFVNEKRPIDQSLLRNGVVDISLIDAPGLNIDSYRTTQVFSRQEEIDLVVFVVSAENHFTLSAKEFITTAAHEKSFIFIVVNRFDNIRDKSKCVNRILDQVADLSPETHKDARDFVHFVSSSKILDNLPDGDDGPGGSGGPDGDPDTDPSDPDFDRLEASLRNFVLEKRSISKLAPAKKYLTNVLQDLEIVADVNLKVSANERDRILAQLGELTPEFEKFMTESVKVSQTIDQQIEQIVQNVYDNTRTSLTKVLNEIGDKPVVPYSSFFTSYSFALESKDAIIQKVQQTVYMCEDFARKETSSGVNVIKSLGILHLGNLPAFNKHFRDDVMFSKRRDLLQRSIVVNLGIGDFIDLSLPTSLHILDEKTDPSSSINNALTLASVVGGGQLIRNSGWVGNALGLYRIVDIRMLKQLVLPAIAIASVCGAIYIISDIPNAVSRNLSRKVRKQLDALDYTHTNSERISKECRKVLKYPWQDVINGFQSKIEAKALQKEKFTRSAKEAEENYKYFKQFQRDASDQNNMVSQCNLDTLEVD